MSPEAKFAVDTIKLAARGVKNAAILGWRASRFLNREVVTPTGKIIHRELSKDMPRMTRRTFLISLLGAGAATLAAQRALEPRRESLSPALPAAPNVEPDKPSISFPQVQLPRLPDSIKPSSPEDKSRDRFIQPFEDKDANEVAKEMEINAGSFFQISAETMSKLKAFQDKQLYPIFPPAIYAYKDLIYKLSAEKGLPPNIIAMIMTIESAGRKEAESVIHGERGAQGLMQVIPSHFQSKGIYNFDQMKDPELNMRYGINVFNDFLEAARGIYRNISVNHPLIYARALMGYNGGSSGLIGGVDGDDNVPQAEDETAFYGDHMIRLILTLEVAASLRKRGFSDSEIIQKLSSPEIEARAYALEKFDRRSRPYSYLKIRPVNEILSLREPWNNNVSGISNAEKALFRQDYNNFLADPSLKSPYHASAGLLIWMALGGKSLIEAETQYNTQPEVWLNINTK